MRLRFWGVRGSIPTPLTPYEVQKRVTAIVQRIKPSDVQSDASREKFVANLPDWLFTTVGGNTSCVEVETADGERIIFDAGSGLRVLGEDLFKRANYKTKRNYHIFLSHFHHDHLQGLAFFGPAYDPENQITVYSTRKKCREYLEGQMTPPYFPVEMFSERGFRADFTFKTIERDERNIRLGSAIINWKLVRHPGGSVSYSITESSASTKETKKFIYSTDTELREKDLIKNEANNEFYKEADILVIDSQYTLVDSIEKEGWGHSTYSMAVDFAINWGIKKILLFHHEPSYADKTIFSIKKSAENYRNYRASSLPVIDIAQEGMDIIL